MTTVTTINPKVLALAAKLDGKLTKVQGYTCTQLTGWLTQLVERGTVEVGWRESCSFTDVTLKIRREWVKVVAALRKSGVQFTETQVQHKNAYAGNNGGFWQSIIYSLPTPNEKGVSPMMINSPQRQPDPIAKTDHAPACHARDRNLRDMIELGFATGRGADPAPILARMGGRSHAASHNELATAVAGAGPVPHDNPDGHHPNIADIDHPNDPDLEAAVAHAERGFNRPRVTLLSPEAARLLGAGDDRSVVKVRCPACGEIVGFDPGARAFLGTLTEPNEPARPAGWCCERGCLRVLDDDATRLERQQAAQEARELEPYDPR